jgi:hypothetical protein
MQKKYWTIAWWLLLLCWVTGALLFMTRINGRFFTNYLADLTFPAWFYIHIRGLTTHDNIPPKLLIVKDWFGLSPKRALISIFTVGLISEAATYFWPKGIISGTFDYVDLLAYAAGLFPCYYFDIMAEKNNNGLNN